MTRKKLNRFNGNSLRIENAHHFSFEIGIQIIMFIYLFLVFPSYGTLLVLILVKYLK